MIEGVARGATIRGRVAAALAAHLLSTAAHAASLSLPRGEVLRLALDAYDCARRSDRVSGTLLTIIDYSLPSTIPRLWVIDVPTRRVLFHELVAHGSGSGDNLAVAFSNEPGSRCSSLGLFRTGEVYRGEHGTSLRLDGLEPGFNDRAMERAIVMHGAPYVNARVAASLGRLGRSWGCPALEPGVDRRVIEHIKGGTAIFAYYPDPQWIAESRFLRCAEQLADGPRAPDPSRGPQAKSSRRVRLRSRSAAPHRA